VDYWGAIGERYGLELTVVNPEVDPAWHFMTLDWDGKIRMDCSSPNAMAGPAEDSVWLMTDDPHHTWVRQTWEGQEVDPRLPMTPMND